MSDVEQLIKVDSRVLIRGNNLLHSQLNLLHTQMSASSSQAISWRGGRAPPRLKSASRR